MKSLDKKEQLREYFVHPTHKYYLEGASKDRIFSNACDEWLEAYVQIENNKIKASYDLKGCAVASSASEAVAKTINGMEKEDAIKLLQDFKLFLENQEEPLPKEFAPFDFLKKQTSRIKCVLFPVDEFLKKLTL